MTIKFKQNFKFRKKKPIKKINVIERNNFFDKHYRTLVIKRVKKYYEIDEIHKQNSVIVGTKGIVPSHLIEKTITYWDW